MKARSSGLTTSACVVHMPCGNPWWTLSVPFLSSFEESSLKEYRLEALSGGSNATADVTVRVEDAYNNMASGRGMKKDIVVGSVEAIVNGINALLAKTERAKALAADVSARKKKSGRTREN